MRRILVQYDVPAICLLVILVVCLILDEMSASVEEGYSRGWGGGGA